MREPLSIEQHQAGRFVAEPLRLNDYCLINDGRVAWIITSAERAKEMRRQPVYISGYARQDTFSDSSTFDDE